MARKKRVRKEDLVKILEQQIDQSDSSETEVSEQRERNHRYYSLQPLGNEQRGRSQYISPTVMDAVEAKKAIFSETFLTSRDAVKFTDSPYPYEAESKTAYVNRVLKRNRYERLLRDGWHDAFVSKDMTVIADWERDTDEVSLSFNQTPEQIAIQQLNEIGDIVDYDDSGLQFSEGISPMGPTLNVSGTLMAEIDAGYVKLTLVKPEHVFRDPMASYIDDAMWFAVMMEMAVGQMIDSGYDPDQVHSLQSHYQFRNSEEDSARRAHDGTTVRGRQMSRADQHEMRCVFRTWTWIDASDGEFDSYDLNFEPRPGFRLYEIHWCDGEVLRYAGQQAEDGEIVEGPHAIMEADEIPAFSWSEMKVSHTDGGMCTADVLAHSQKAESSLKRLVIDNQQQRNNPSLLALQNALTKPRDLLSQKIGQVHFTKNMDAVRELNVGDISPMTMQVLQMLKMDDEEKSGVTALGKGMNTDAIKHQNAADMIERLTNAGNRRITMQARDFANSFLIPLCQYIVKLAKRHDRSVQYMEMMGQQIPIAPQSWQDEDDTMDVAVALTPEEAERTAQNLMMLHQMQSADPAMSVMYGPAQRHAMYDRVYELLGVTDTSPFMLSPQSQEYQQAMQAQQQQAQQQAMMMQRAQQMQEQMAQAQLMISQSGDQREWAKFQWDQTDDMQDNLREDEKLRWEKERESQELEIEREQKRGASIG